jgi:hypothetical protein
MIARKFICPAIVLATIATMVAEDIHPDKAAPVDESLVAAEEAAEEIAGQDAGETAEEAVQEAVEEVTEDAAEEITQEAAEEADTPEDDTLDAGETTEEEAEEPVEEIRPEEVQAEPELLEEVPPGDPAPGLAVRVEKLQSGDQAIDPAQVRVLAPFPAKLLAQTPAGWRIETAENAPHFTREVELAPGKHISLTVRPHVLVPDADGSTVFSIPEPGYSAPLGYHQDATVGAILSTSIRQLDKDAAELGDAIDQLQQLLVSLPKEEEPPAAPETQPVNKRQR